MLSRKMLCFVGLFAVTVGFKFDFDSSQTKDPANESEEIRKETFNQPDEPIFDSEDFEETEDVDDLAELSNFIGKMSHHRDTIKVSNGGVWGPWGRAEFCPKGAYAVGYDLKIEPRQGRGDDTALNAIKLLCEYPGGAVGGEISSTESRWGNWQGRRTCERKHFLTRFQLRVERSLGSKVDDTAANFARFMCRDLRGFRKEYTLEVALGSGLGNWGEFGFWSSSCRMGQAICGIQTKVEASCGRSCDDTALNDVKFFCCE